MTSETSWTLRPKKHVLRTDNLGTTFRKVCSCGWEGDIFRFNDGDQAIAQKCEAHVAEGNAALTVVDPLRAFLNAQPELKKPSWGEFDAAIGVAIKDLRKHYRLDRKNKKKDVPYLGYPIGRESRAGCIDALDSFVFSGEGATVLSDELPVMPVVDVENPPPTKR